MSRTNGPIWVFSREDTVPTDAEGGYAGGDSTAKAVGTSLAQSGKALGTVDNLAVTASTLDYGQEATATISGASPWKTIHVGIPKGMPGMGYEQGQQLLAQNQTTLDAAQQAEANADAAVALAQQAQAASLEVPDDNVSALVGNTATLTRQALDDTYQTAVLVTSQPGATDRDKLISALTVASAQGGTVHLPDGVVDVGNGLSLSGFSCGIVGHGASRGSRGRSVIRASTQSGPVLDFSGFLWPPGYRGRIRMGGFTVEGSGVADATRANVGIQLGSVPGPGAVTWRDIMVWKTGGECIVGTYVYLHNFESINLVSPFGARENDVPYMRLVGSNGNNIDINCYEESTGGAAATVGAGVSGVFVLETGEGVYYSSKNNINVRTENVHIPSNGTVLNVCGAANIISHRDWDSRQDDGATGTSYIRLTADGVAVGGNTIVGMIPGFNTASNPTVSWGVDVRENGARIVGVKGYSGNNVRLAPGVKNVYAELGGAASSATGAAFVDESGGFYENTLIDNVVGSQSRRGVLMTPVRDLSSYYMRVQMQNYPDRGGLRFGNGASEINTVGDIMRVSATRLRLGGADPLEVMGKQLFFPSASELPVASGANYRSMILLSVSGSDDQMMMCLRRADGSYYWKEL